MINRQEYEKMDYFEMLFSMYIILSKAILCDFWYYTAAYIEIEFTIFPINFAILKKYCHLIFSEKNITNSWFLVHCTWFIWIFKLDNSVIRGFFKKWSSFGEKTAVHWFLKCQMARFRIFVLYLSVKYVDFNFRITIRYFFANFNSMKLAIIGKLVNWGENYLYFLHIRVNMKSVEHVNKVI